MTTTATVGYLTVHHEVSGYQRERGPARRGATGYQRQAGYGMPDTTAYSREAGLFGPGLRPTTEWFQDDRSLNGHPLWMAEQVLTLADDHAVQVAQQARDEAAALRAAAERDAAAIRAAAERDAAEMRARLDSMLDELGRFVAAYVVDSLAAPATQSTAPTQPAGLPAAASAVPATKPAKPETTPGTKSDRPATTPEKKQQKRPRQLQAMRIARYGTAALLAFALAAGASEVSQHGYKFFVFREGGQGQTKNNSTDQQFLDQQAAAAHHQAPKGRHHKTPHAALKPATTGKPASPGRARAGNRNARKP